MPDRGKIVGKEKKKRHVRRCDRGCAHAKKEEERNDVCGAAGKGGTAHVKKEKAGNNVCGAAGKGGTAHAKKKKARNNVCGAAGKGGTAHAKKKKARNNVCGAAPAIPEHPQKGNLHTPSKKIPQQ